MSESGLFVADDSPSSAWYNPVAEEAPRRKAAMRARFPDLFGELVGDYARDRGWDWRFIESDDEYPSAVVRLRMSKTAIGDPRERAFPVRTGDGEEFLGTLAVRWTAERWAERGDDEKVLELLIRSAIRELELRLSEEELLGELCLTNERLAAVSELSTRLRSATSAEGILEDLARRAGDIQPGARMEAAIWSESGDVLTVAATTLPEKPGPRDARNGLLGRALRKMKPMVIKEDSSARLLASDEEPELATANVALIAPVETAGGRRAILELWRAEPAPGNASIGSPTMQVALAFALQGAMAMEMAELHRKALENERLTRDLEIGSRIQQTLLLSAPPSDIEGLRLAAVSESSSQVDGDFLEFLRHDDNTLDLIVGDVMGKGIPAALTGAATKNEFHRALGRLLWADGERPPSAREWVNRVHRELGARLMELESFVTLNLTRFDLAAGRMTFVDCGHTRTLHLRAGARECEPLQGDNVPLGFSPREVYDEHVLPIGPGDVLVFYSDGLTETRGPEGEFYGEDRLARLVARHRNAPTNRLLSIIREDVKRFRGNERLTDDLTLVVARIGDEPSEEPIREELRLDSALDELPKLRRALRDLAKRGPGPLWDESSHYQLEVAAYEAVTNLIEHAYGNESGHEILVIATAGYDGMELELRHRGRPLHRDGVAEPRFDGSADGGFGVFIIESYVDEFRQEIRDDGEVRVVLRKKKPG